MDGGVIGAIDGGTIPHTVGMHTGGMSMLLLHSGCICPSTQRQTHVACAGAPDVSIAASTAPSAAIHRIPVSRMHLSPGPAHSTPARARLSTQPRRGGPAADSESFNQLSAKLVLQQWERDMRVRAQLRRAGAHRAADHFDTSSSPNLDSWILGFLSLAVSGIAVLSAALLAAMFA